VVVLSFKFDQNWLSSYGYFGVKIWVPALLWPVAYTALYYRTGVIQELVIMCTHKLLY